MNINGKSYRTIWLGADGWSVEIIDQTKLPHELAFVTLETMADAGRAILTMQVRGAPLIGATAAYGVCLALREDASDEALDRAIDHLAKQRPTAVNLRWALDEMRGAVRNLPRERRVAAAYKRAAEICDADVDTNRAIGMHGAKLIEAIVDPDEKILLDADRFNNGRRVDGDPRAAARWTSRAVYWVQNQIDFLTVAW